MAVVGAPAYFARRPAPKSPRDLTEHNCINLRLPTHGGLYAWEFEKGGRELRVRVEGQFVANGTAAMLKAAVAGVGFAYVPEDMAQPHVDDCKLTRVLADWCPAYDGYHLILRESAAAVGGVYEVRGGRAVSALERNLRC